MAEKVNENEESEGDEREMMETALTEVETHTVPMMHNDQIEWGDGE